VSILGSADDAVKLAQPTSGGPSIHRRISDASTNAQSVKATPGQIWEIVATNSNGSVRYLKLYDKASAPTVGTDVPKCTYMLPAGGGVHLKFVRGVPFTIGIASAMTTGAADSDTAAVAANEVIIHIHYT